MFWQDLMRQQLEIWKQMAYQEERNMNDEITNMFVLKIGVKI